MCEGRVARNETESLTTATCGAEIPIFGFIQRDRHILPIIHPEVYKIWKGRIDRVRENEKARRRKTEAERGRGP